MTTKATVAMLNRRALVFAAAGLLTLAFLTWYSGTGHGPPTIPRHGGFRHIFGTSPRFDGRWDFQRDAGNLLLDSRQCDQAFPGLFVEVERPVNQRLAQSRVTLDELDSIPKQNGFVRAMIYDQQVCFANFLVLSSENGGLFRWVSLLNNASLVANLNTWGYSST